MRKEIIKNLRAELRRNKKELNSLLETNMVVTTLSLELPENRSEFQKMIIQRRIFESLIDLLKSDKTLNEIVEVLASFQTEFLEAEEYEVAATYIKWQKEIEMVLNKTKSAV